LLKEVLGALIPIVAKRSVKFIPRVHPRLNEIAPQVFGPWNEQLSEFGNNFPGTLVTDQEIIRGDMKTLLLASNVVISDFSTVLLEAGLIGAQLDGSNNISACYTPTVIEEFKGVYGKLSVNEPVFVTLGCTAKATSRDEMEKLIDLSLTKGLSLLEAQKSNYRMDGKNAYRVAEFIASLR
jgi:hypothetical protein